uniref:Uncharacterized protein n=1 Tax=Planktothrix pseudagardhii TaxID=132604 RepID=A0A9W4CE22_9CYAN|nr:hypothetical protein NO713_00148 [Planktothrix pseudagardhii]
MSLEKRYNILQDIQNFLRLTMTPSQQFDYQNIQPISQPIEPKKQGAIREIQLT